jgi:hypothetical protein
MQDQEPHHCRIRHQKLQATLGVAQYRMLSKLPKRLADQLPSPKQIEKLLGDLD